MNVHETIKKYTIGDGLSIVLDLEKSKGSWIVDKLTGKNYLDCYSLFASQPIGWNHPKLVERENRLFKVVRHNITNSDLYTEQYANFIEKFAEITPDFKYYFFIAGGSLGVENALKASFDWKAKISRKEEFDVIHLENAFHGRSGYTLSLTNTDPVKTDIFPKFSWTKVVAPSLTFPCYLDKVEELEQLSLTKMEDALKRKNVAAIILEPIQGEGGDNHFRKEYLQAVRKLATDYYAMLIFDEVQTGLGLTGKMWCYEHFGIIPDILVFGKKAQVCGFCSTGKIDKITNNVFRESGRINSTWGGNLVDMVRATIYFEIIKEDNLLDNARVVGDYFVSKLRELPLANVRGRGLMIAFDLPSREERDAFHSKLSEKMLSLKCGEKSIRFRPHLTFSKIDVDAAVGFVKEVMK